MRGLAILLLLLPSLSQAQNKIRIAVPDFEGRAADPILVKECAARVNAELHKLGVFEVTSQDDIRALLAHERQKDLLGCDDTSCIAEIGGALGVDYLVTGAVTLLSGRHSIDLRLVSVAEGKVANVVKEDLAGQPTEIVDRAGGVAVGLVSKLFETMKGSLVLACDEPDATVKIDGAEWATTPVRGRIELPFGPHLVEVQKTGFLAFRQRVTVAPNEAVERAVTLVPSPDFIDEFESSQTKLRVGAWIATVTAGVALGTAGYFAFNAGAAYSDFKPLQRELELDPSNDSVRTRAAELADEVRLSDRIALGTGGAALLSAILATIFWIVGEDPGRYETFKVVPSISAAEASE